MRISTLFAFVLFAVAQPASSEPQQRPSSFSDARLGSPKDEEGPPPVRTRAAPEADVALTRALLWAFEPAPLEIRVLAVEDLGLLGDERALNPLAQLAIDPNPSIQRAALVSVRRFQAPRAEEILSNVIRHPALREPLKLQAIAALPYQCTKSARQTLARIAGGAGFGYNLRAAAQRALAEWDAASAPEGIR